MVYLDSETPSDVYFFAPTYSQVDPNFREYVFELELANGDQVLTRVLGLEIDRRKLVWRNKVSADVQAPNKGIFNYRLWLCEDAGYPENGIVIDSGKLRVTRSTTYFAPKNPTIPEFNVRNT